MSMSLILWQGRLYECSGSGTAFEWCVWYRLEIPLVGINIGTPDCISWCVFAWKEIRKQMAFTPAFHSGGLNSSISILHNINKHFYVTFCSIAKPIRWHCTLWNLFDVPIYLAVGHGHSCYIQGCFCSFTNIHPPWKGDLNCQSWSSTTNWQIIYSNDIGIDSVVSSMVLEPVVCRYSVIGPYSQLIFCCLPR